MHRIRSRLLQGVSAVTHFSLTLALTLLAFGAPASAASTDWLLLQQQTDGSISTPQDIARPTQSTAEAIRALRLEGRVANVPAAEIYLFLQEYRGTEDLARLIIANVERGVSSPAFVTQLLTHQNADGGFGELPGFQSTPLDTAYALSALARAGQINSSQAQAALNLLLITQDAAGGWGLAPNDSSTFVTAIALEALWQGRNTRQAAAVAAARAKSFLLAQRSASGLWATDFESALALIALAPMQVAQGELGASTAALNALRTANESWGNDVYTTALALRAITLASAATPNPDLASVTGTVVDGDSLVIMSGVTVRLSGQAAVTRTTNALGVFTFPELAAGNYSLAIEASGYPTINAPLTLRAGQTLNLGVLHMTRGSTPTTARVEGRITDETGADLPGVTISVTGAPSVLSDGSGRYIVNDVPTGNVVLNASKTGYFAAQGTTTLVAGSTVNFSVALRSVTTAGFSLSGTFTDEANGQPLSGVRVEISGSATASLVSGAGGTVAAQNLSPGEVRIVTSLAGYQSRTAMVTVNGGQTLDVSTVLQAVAPGSPPTFVLSGRVTDNATGAPVPGASITLLNGVSGNTTSAADGSYELAGLVPADFTVVVSADGYQSASGSTTAQPFQTIDFSPALVKVDERPTALRARVIDAETLEPIEGALVTVSVGSDTAVALTEPGGEFLVRNLAAADASVAISASGYEPHQLTLSLAAGYINDLGQLALRPVANSQATSLAGRVMNSSTDAPIAGATVTAISLAGIETTLSGADGSFSLPATTGAVVELTFTQDGYRESRFTVVVTADNAQLGQVRLRPEGLDSFLADLAVTAVDGSLLSSTVDSFEVSGTVIAHLQNRGYAATGMATELVAFEDRNGNGALDEGEPRLGEATLAAGLQAGTATTVSFAIAGSLSFRDAPVTVLADATHLLVERTEDNNSLATVGSCVAIPPAASALAPVQKWRWSGSTEVPSDNEVFGPVMVGQMSDDNGDAVIDSRDVPDLVFNSRGQRLTIVSGATGQTIRQSAPSTVTGLGSPALADLDGDGDLEIVSSNGLRTRLVAFHHDLTPYFDVPHGPRDSDTTRDGITIADLNGDGHPEILSGRRVYSHVGALLWEGDRDSGGIATYGTVPIAVDLNGDGILEVVAGRTAYRASDGLRLWHTAAVPADGFNAVGNFDSDPEPEIVVVGGGYVTILQHNGDILRGPVTLPSSGGRGGAPTVGDFDGDGEPEIGVAGAREYTVFDTDLSEMWRIGIFDSSSALTGSSLFDFDGDGRTEVVYADERFLYIYEGEDGDELVRIPNVSGTTLEYPVVADVDGDGRAELVVASNDGSSPGVRVFEGGAGEWMPTRAIWNQSAYHITNVNDDGTIPRNEEASWLLYNSYRQNAAIPRAEEAVSDLTAGNLKLLDGGIGQPSSLVVRIGNAGAALGAGLASVTFYDGAPTAGGISLGTVAIPALAPGQFADVRLDGITSVSSNGTLFAVADSTRRVTECDEINNTASTPGRPARGTLQVSTDSAVYTPGAGVQIRAITTNSGHFTNSYRVQLTVQDAAGSAIGTLPPQSVTNLASGAQHQFDVPFGSAGLLAGNYRVFGELFDSAGELLNTSTASFEIRHDSTQNPAASLRINTDRPVYHTSDSVLIDALARNLTTSTVMSGLQVRIQVNVAGGASLLDLTVPVGEFVPGATRPLQQLLPLIAAAEGSYDVSGTLLDASGTPLASASAGFTVVSDPMLTLQGTVALSSSTVVAGDSLICTRTVQNAGTLAHSALPLRSIVVRIADEAIVDEHHFVVSLAAGESESSLRSTSTSGYSAGDYACALQAQIGGQWEDLAHAIFNVTAPPVRIDATLTAGTRGRLLVLMDDYGGWPCSPVRDVELWAPFRMQLPTGSRIDVELFNSQDTRVDFETVTLSNYHGTVNQRTGSGADLRIIGASRDVVTVQVVSSSGLGEGYRVVATATADSLPPVVVESNVMGERCGWRAGIGARFGDFHCSGGHGHGGTPLPPPAMSSPTPAEQRAFLEQLLGTNGWSYKIVTDDEHFERELRTGAYSQYLLLSEHEKLDEQVQKELREAVYRGEGLLDAGRHDRRHHRFDAALGITPVGKLPGANAVEFSAPWLPAGTAALHPDHDILRARSSGAVTVARFPGVAGHDMAVGSFTYGRGKTVYVGYDLLAEATRSGVDSLHALLLKNGLDQVRPDLSRPLVGQVVPLVVTLQNRGEAAAGRVVLPLPTGVTPIDPGGAQVQGGTLYWTYSLAADESRSFTAWVRLPDTAGPVAFDANVQLGPAPTFTDHTHAALSLTTSDRATLAQARDLAGSHIRFLLVKFWLLKTQFWLEAGHRHFALASLVQAADEAIRVSHPQAGELRLMIDEAIWRLSRQL